MTSVVELRMGLFHCLVIEDAAAGIQAVRAGNMTALGIARLGDEALLQTAGTDPSGRGRTRMRLVYRHLQQDKPMHRIHDVTSAKTFRIAEDGTEWIGVTATGTSACLGWRAPLLSPWLYTEKPTDNIQDFDFCAEEPARMISGAPAPVAADYLIERSRIHYWGEGNDLAGIRVHSSQNEIEAHFSNEEPLDPATMPPHIQTIDAPWSWLGSREPETANESSSGRKSVADGSLASIIGTKLRLLENKDRVDPSPVVGCTTIRIDADTRVIKTAWTG